MTDDPYIYHSILFFIGVTVARISVVLFELTTFPELSELHHESRHELEHEKAHITTIGRGHILRCRGKTEYLVPPNALKTSIAEPDEFDG